MNWVIAAIVTIVVLLMAIDVIRYKIKVEHLKQKMDEFIEMHNHMKREIGSNTHEEYEFKCKYYNITFENGDFKTFWLYSRVCAFDVSGDYEDLDKNFLLELFGDSEILEDYMKDISAIERKSRYEIWKNGWS